MRAEEQPDNVTPSTAEKRDDVAGEPDAPRVLVVDDELAVTRSFERLLTGHGFQVSVAHSGREAIEKTRLVSFDAIVSDLHMPDIDGRGLLRSIRADNLDVPFVFLTGSPDTESAIEAIEYGAFRYLVKPVPPKELVDTLKRAARWHRLALIRREAVGELEGRAIGDRAGLEARFDSALEKLWMAMQPIVSWSTRTVLAYEALARTDEPSLRNPAELFDTAEQLGRTGHIGRAIRGKIASLIPQAPEPALIFVNLHPKDLEDPELLSERGALAPFARRVVLEITERAALDKISGLHERVAALRGLGYRIAVDDLGAGYAGLSIFAAIEPDVVKQTCLWCEGSSGRRSNRSSSEPSRHSARTSVSSLSRRELKRSRSGTAFARWGAMRSRAICSHGRTGASLHPGIRNSSITQ
jgi:EAL domain-containing protein (putative c-di-GMP-specific phosphodiesterase class I)/CheY-like chemotaxis protein